MIIVAAELAKNYYDVLFTVIEHFLSLLYLYIFRFSVYILYQLKNMSSLDGCCEVDFIDGFVGRMLLKQAVTFLPGMYVVASRYYTNKSL